MLQQKIWAAFRFTVLFNSGETLASPSWSSGEAEQWFTCRTLIFKVNWSLPDQSPPPRGTVNKDARGRPLQTHAVFSVEQCYCFWELTNVLSISVGILWTQLMDLHVKTPFCTMNTHFYSDFQRNNESMGFLEKKWMNSEPPGCYSMEIMHTLSQVKAAAFVTTPPEPHIN